MEQCWDFLWAKSRVWLLNGMDINSLMQDKLRVCSFW